MATIPVIQLIDLVDGEQHPLGAALGKKVFERLRKVLVDRPFAELFEISMKGIKLTDSSFARESVISVVKLYRGEKGFFLSGITSQDFIDNWDYVAERKEQPIIIERSKGRYELIGLSVSSGLRQIFDYAMKVGTLTTAKVAEQFELSPQNASQKLKKLYQMGLLLGTKETAETGGLEYVYRAIGRL